MTDHSACDDGVYTRAGMPWNEPSADETPLAELLASLRGASEEVRQNFWRSVREAVQQTSGYDQEMADRYARQKQDRRLVELNWGNRTKTGTIYYIRFVDRVKIGITVNLPRRLSELPHDELLATEVGDYALEQERHEQFADLRAHGEWFWYRGALVEHIATLRR